LREIGMASGDLPQPDDGPRFEPAMIEAAFQDVDLDSLDRSADVLKQAALTISGIDLIFEAHGGGRGPDLSPLAGLIRQASSAVQPRLDARRGVASSEDSTGTATDGGNGAAQASRAGRGEIASRDDVIRALDQICAYYARYEPSSPLPMLLERCKRLVPMSFVEIVRDIVPDAMSQVELIAGRREE
jgi:type VI secretion system protein ImpA